MQNKNNTPKRRKIPWPTKAAMEQVYDMNLWGSNHTKFYSGEGSHHPKIVNPYIQAVKTFLTGFTSPLIVCDLGCGDFNVGKALVQCTKQYRAVDIVENLIKYNQETFKIDALEFQCLDIATDDLPSGDCVLIRQVLQHLSNAEIQQIVKKLPTYKYVILTEHLPIGEFEPNKDIISGQGIRLKKQSGINLLAPPFHLNVKTEEELLSITLDEDKGIIKTTLYTMY